MAKKSNTEKALLLVRELVHVPENEKNLSKIDELLSEIIASEKETAGEEEKGTGGKDQGKAGKDDKPPVLTAEQQKAEDKKIADAAKNSGTGTGAGSGSARS